MTIFFDRYREIQIITEGMSLWVHNLRTCGFSGSLSKQIKPEMLVLKTITVSFPGFNKGRYTDYFNSFSVQFANVRLKKLSSLDFDRMISNFSSISWNRNAFLTKTNVKPWLSCEKMTACIIITKTAKGNCGVETVDLRCNEIYLYTENFAEL